MKAAARFGEFFMFQYAVKRYRIISAIAECKGWADFFGLSNSVVPKSLNLENFVTEHAQVIITFP